ncbi:Arrestin domain-containing protein 3 [Halotydeus destructor]|nr:Arrestin domain-containing protein 3 [Halotydeus destructor]
MGRLKSFEIVLNNNKNVYYPNDEVRGKCVLELRGELKLNEIRIFMRGLAKVHWSESKSTGNRLGAYTEHYNAEIEYFFKKQVLCGSECETRDVVLNEGHHEFNFVFQLPPSGISTSFEGKYGSVRYWLKCEVEKPWAFNHKTKKAFTVISHIDINKPEYLIPVESSIEKRLCCWCCISGPVCLVARTDRKGYCPGESIAITADFENHSNRTVIPQASLHQTQTFVAGGKYRSRKFKFTVVSGIAIQPGRTTNWDSQLLKIPAVSPSIVNCCLIKVEYFVRMTLAITGGHNLSLDLPIIVGTVPLRTRPPRYRPPMLRDLRMPRITSSLTSSLSQQHSSDSQSSSFERIEPPPTYAQCILGSVDIGDDEDGDIIGDTRFTPTYAYVHEYVHQPPPAYSEIDPNPVLETSN